MKAEIRAELAQRITFATHQCDVPVIADLVISNPSDTDLENLKLQLRSEPPVIGERTWIIDRIRAGSEHRIHDRRIPLAGSLLDSLTERMRADVKLELRRGQEVLVEHTHSLIALARNEWGGADFMPELLAAFVMPNDPAVQRLLKEAARILESSGKASRLDGYQSRSRKRSWEIVSGIWAAVVRRGLTYAEPPASFERQGQKIRFPSMIEEHGLATCLDTALLFAAAIEQAGLYPVVVFTQGHAFAGAWLQPQSLPSLTVEDPMEIRKAVAQDELLLFETTLATSGHAMPFTRAIEEAKRQISEEHEDRFVYAIDIRQARGRDIQPLSSIARDTGDASAAPDPSRAAPPLDEAPDLPPFDVELITDEDRPQTPEERLDRWKRSLLDLSKRNRLLNLKPSATAIPIFCPDPAALEDKLAQGKRIRLISPPPRQGGSTAPDKTLYHLRTGEDFDVKFALEALERDEIVANVEPHVLEKGTIELYRKAKADFEEGGSNTLFLALGMLRWTPPGETRRSYRAPLVLLPVKLERRSAASKPYLTSHEDDAVFNPTLLQMLRQDFQIDIPQLVGDLPTDEHGVDVRKIWGWVRARVRDVPGFEVVEDVVLSTFSFAKYLMWKDLADRTEALKQSPFVKHMIETPRDAYERGALFLEPRTIDSKIDPSELMAPLNADSSQIVAIHASGKEGDFVLEGPPGTGKSETIGNIIAHSIALGHRVLFVSEKMAALDVVYRRLKACGLGDFCLELHSAKANKRAVLQQLDAAWKQRRAFSPEAWQQKASRLREVRDRLNGLVEALHAPGPGGISPRDAIGRSLRYADVHRLELDWERDASGRGHAPTPEALGKLEELAKRVGQQFSQLQPEDFAAFRCITHADWSFEWTGSIVNAARELRGAIQTLAQLQRSLVQRLGLPKVRYDLDDASALAEIASLVPECAAMDMRLALEPGGREAMDLLGRLLDHLSAYRGDRSKLSSAYSDDRVAKAPLESWLAERKRSETKLWLFRLLARRKLRKAMWAELQIGPASVPAPEADLEALIELARQRAELDELAASLPASTPWRGLRTDVSASKALLTAARRLREAVARLSSFTQAPAETRSALLRSLCEAREGLEPGKPTAEVARQYLEAHRRFIDCLERFRSASESDKGETPSVKDLRALFESAKAIVEREPRLKAWCDWIAVARDARQAGLGCLLPALETGAVSPDQTVEAFRTAYARWVAPILIDTRPPLKRFSAVEHEDLINTFRALDREFAEVTAAYIRAKLSGQVPSRDSAKSHPGYGVLARELQKRMRHKPIRQLIGEMGDALTTLTPCLMMSPLSVAQFLPPDAELFDLVVFDEASQITVPDAIGAIARGKRCIIVGDPRQMPPTRFFERGPEDDENEEARDLESILDEALAARVPHHRLTGHYRSRHESLICFSNHAYYQGSLITYPSADTRETAVTFRRVNGVYAQGRSRTNEIEAKAVVAEVVRRLNDPQLSQLSIGIVTLNSEQQRLIEDLLDQARRANPELERFFIASEEGGKRREPVFVKNLETVQGDQRDVILLSIGYGPTTPGGKTMSMNFGPLNRQGGERRLNVAITRATTEVVVFASFDPSMIDLSRTSARAVRDLKHYLDFAARGPVALGEAIESVSTDRYDSDFELAVAERLRARGWTIQTQVGVSKFRIDLAVVHPDAAGRYLAGIECDGATYHSSPSARDRDRVRHIILEQLGWRLLRVWSTDFFIDPETSIARLDAKLNALLEADRSAEKTAESSADSSELPDTDTWDESLSPDEDEDSAPEAGDGGPQGTSNQDSEVEAPRQIELAVDAADSSPVRRIARATQSDTVSELACDPTRFYEPDYRPKLQRMAATIIDGEGPITFKCLTDRIARAHGFQRTGRQISSTVWAACRRLRRYASTPDGHKVFWPEGTEPAEHFVFRGLNVNGERREWREVPYPEKLWLVRKVLEQGPDDPARAVAQLIGLGRISTNFRNEIAALVDRVKGGMGER